MLLTTTMALITGRGPISACSMFTIKSQKTCPEAIQHEASARNAGFTHRAVVDAENGLRAPGERRRGTLSYSDCRNRGCRTIYELGWTVTICE